MVLSASGVTPGLSAEHVGHQASRLAGVKGNPDQKPGQPGAERAHLPPDRLLDDRLQEHRMLDVQLLAHGLAQEGRAGGRDAQAFLPGDPVDLGLDLALDPDGHPLEPAFPAGFL